MTRKEHNDTPVQSQFERDKTVANDEGGSDRPSVGVKLPWCRLAPDRLASYIPKLHLNTQRRYRKMKHTYLRGDIYYADLGHGVGSEQEGSRPVVIIQNNVGKKYSPTVIVGSITSKP